MPEPTPVTTRVALLTVATDVLLLLQVPPVTVSLSVVVAPIHTLTADEGVIATGVVLTTTVAVAKHVPMEYVIITLPATAPVTTPTEGLPMVAVAVLPLLHTPPASASDIVTLPVVHTGAGFGVMGATPLMTAIDFVTEQFELFV